MDNRLTISTLACPEWSLETIVDRCRAHGIAGIDFRGLGPTLDHGALPAFTTELASTRALLDGHGLSVPCMCSSVALMTPDADRWRAMLDEFGRHLRIADALGSAFVRIFPGSTPPGMSRRDAAALARRRAHQLVTLADGHAARPALETHDDWGSAADVVTLLADCVPAAFPVIWDVRHTWAAGETSAQSIATLGDRLAHVHVKDATIVDGHEEPTLLGAGVVPVAAALGALKDVGYGGWICLETERRWRPETAPEPEDSIPQFAAFVRGI